MEQGRVPTPKVDAFLAEIEAVCVKHGMSISHEDGHGAFIIEKHGHSWLDEAMVGDTLGEGER